MGYHAHGSGSLVAARRAGWRAFTLVELLVVIAIIALLISIILPGLGCTRKTGRQVQNAANLKNLITAVHSYAGEYREQIATFSWQAGGRYQLATGMSAGGQITTTTFTGTSDLLAAAAQALDIIRRRSQPECVGMPTQNNWIPHPTYNHLVLMDYLAARLPDPMIVAPEDRFRLRLAEGLRASGNALAFCQSLSGPQYNGMRITWPYSSSYQMTPAAYTPNRESGDNGLLRQGDNQIFYVYQQGSAGRYKLGGRKLSEVLFAAQKVCIMEDVSRQLCGKNEMPWLYDQAQATVATYDGAVHAPRTIDCNTGGYTRLNGRKIAAIMAYEPQTAWGYPTWPTGEDPRELTLFGRYRWTHEGLRGIDFGGREPDIFENRQ
ncbi:MAG: prepilin-type N-terminal cleavage/methylation domain-containing protein [Phycisphaerales bacterium]